MQEVKRETLLVLALLVSSIDAYSAVGSGRVIGQDEFAAALIASAQSQLVYKGSESDASADRELRGFSTTACATLFAIEIVQYVYSDGLKALPADKVERKLAQVEMKSMERKLQESCSHIDTSGKALAVINGAFAAVVSLESDSRPTQRSTEKRLPSGNPSAPLSERTIDLVGIVPGISKVLDVERASHTRNHFCQPFCLEIGGYNLACDAEYDQSEAVATLTCWFGKKVGDADNSEVFRILKAGFLAKFGQPVMDRRFQVQNAFGARFDGEDLRWRDKEGNTLELQSPVHRVDQGALAIKSTAQNKINRENDEKKKIDRKF